MRDEQRGPYPPHTSDWWISEAGKGMCRSCGEERLVHKFKDVRGEQHFCRVCSHAWWITGPLPEAVSRAGGYRPDGSMVDVNRVVMTDP